MQVPRFSPRISLIESGPRPTPATASLAAVPCPCPALFITTDRHTHIIKFNVNNEKSAQSHNSIVSLPSLALLNSYKPHKNNFASYSFPLLFYTLNELLPKKFKFFSMIHFNWPIMRVPKIMLCEDGVPSIWFIYICDKMSCCWEQPQEH
jgi:hypothetical protein